MSDEISTRSDAWRLPEEAARALLNQAGFHGEFQFIPIQGGGNNRVFKVESANKTLLLKAYFSEPSDPRDRLRHEFEFIEYAWEYGVRFVPEPYIADRKNRLALYEFIHGKKLKLEEVNEEHIDQAIQFYLDTNRSRATDQAASLLPASEACFSIAEHIATTEKRIQRLAKMDGELKIDHEAQKFVQKKLVPLWEKLCDYLHRETKKESNIAETLLREERCLSPSDFGYHNTILEKSGKLRFLDFEYSGWDDPAKLICDFANQPDMILPEKLSSKFQKVVVESDMFPEKLATRVQWLTPLYQIKWSCITLNDFLPFGRNRRQFTDLKEAESDKKAKQLAKAQNMYHRADVAMREMGIRSKS